VTPVDADLSEQLGKEPLPDLVDRRPILDWDCRTQTESRVNKDALDGKLTLPVIAQFFVGAPGAPLTKSTNATARMQILTMALLKLPTTRQLVRLVQAKFGKHEVPIDVKTFDWLKPFAQFRLHAVISYKWFKATLQGGKQHFYFALPHEAKLDVSIAGFCNMLGVLKGRKEEGKTLEGAEAVGTSDDPASAEARKEHLEKEKTDLEKKAGKSDKERLDEINGELEELEEQAPTPEDEGPVPDGGDTNPFDWELKPPTHSGD